ncbi:nucleoside triphosphate pyrophosphohydrolase, partial [Candidatus Saccharibacteria bacterium]|nr:nucleoside triphosphate pyrophosphohydrolase [Candidatus Saccharibacteria bacterium]
MSKKVYNKLVRDKIPEIIEADGKKAKTIILNNHDYVEELIKKLGEEYEEFKADRNIEELADIQEVLLA